ncbi:MAG: hypothetical protein KF764_27175 [Labilithrix sp.]|nr:hypothetical protein [Labilithrix sp.]
MPRRTVNEKAEAARNVAAVADPRQLQLALADESASRAAAGEASGDATRAQAIVASFDRLSSEEVFEAFEELDALPPDVVRDALAASTGPAPDLERLDEATRRAHGLPPRALRLRTISVVKDADIFDLGEVAEEQLRLAGKAWDGRELAAEERLDDEVEGSFAGTLEHRVLAEAGGANAALFDVLLYAGDAGSIFRAGTSELVGAIAYSTVEMKDRRARSAIQAALEAPALEEAELEEAEPSLEPETLAAPPEAASEPPTEKRPSPSTRRVAEAASPKKTPARAAAPGAPAKKAPAKKASATKAPAAPVEETAAKKTAPAKKKTSAAKTSAAKKTAPAKKASAAKKTAPAKTAPSAKTASAKKKTSAAKTASAKKTPSKS